MDWYRRWHDSDNDVKFLSIAKKTGHHICFVKAIWESLLTYASMQEEKGNERGSLQDVSLEDIANSNHLDEVVAKEIYEAFKQRKMIVFDNDSHLERFANWKKRQPASDSSNERVKRYRENKKQESNTNTLNCNENVAECNNDVTLQKRKVTPPETDTDTERKRSSSELPKAPIEKIPFLEILGIWNQVMDGKVMDFGKSRAAKFKKLLPQLKKLYGDDPPTAWRKYCERIQASDFLSGRSGKFTATFDWVLEPKNIIKILEGNYENGSSRGANNPSKPAEFDAVRAGAFTALARHKAKQFGGGNPSESGFFSTDSS